MIEIDYVAISTPFWLNPRYHAINVEDSKGNKWCMRYERYLLEQKLGRKLEPNERVVNGELTTLEEIEETRKQLLAREALLRALRKK